MSHNNNKSNIIWRYTIITIIFFVFAMAVVVKLFNTTVIDASEWNRRARSELSKVTIIKPERGNILADNGNILACNLKVFDIKVDLRHQKVAKLKPIPWEKVDSLADSLDYYYPRVKNLNQHPDTFKKYSWHTKLKKELETAPAKRTRALRIAKKKTIDDFERIRKFPFFKDFKGNGFRNPVYKEEKNVRIYPYGKMAYRSIGRVNESQETGNFQAPVRGFDIHTTIDIDLQDMLEEQLLNVCSEVNAEWGTAILMEVATGEIKAISNIELLDNGTYGEASDGPAAGPRR